MNEIMTKSLFKISFYIFLAMSLLTGCNEEDGPKKAESEVDLSDPNDVKIFMGHFGDNKKERREFWEKIEGKKASIEGENTEVKSYDNSIYFKGTGVTCVASDLYKHHILKHVDGDNFKCTGTYDSYNVYVGNRVGVSLRYQPTEEAKVLYDKRPEVTKRTDLDAHKESLKMGGMTQILREQYWDAELSGKLMYVQASVGEVTSSSLLMDSKVLYFNSNIVCSINPRDEYLIRNIRKGENFVCAGKASETYIQLGDGPSVFTIYYDPTVGKLVK